MSELPIIRLEIDRMKYTIAAMMSKEGAALSSEINRAVLEYLSDDNINHIVQQEVRDTVNAAVKEEIREFFKGTNPGRLAIREAVLNHLNEIYPAKAPIETKLIKMAREIDPAAAEWIVHKAEHIGKI